MRMGRVAVYLPELLGGGAERITLTLAGGLVARGHAVDLVLNRRVGPLADQVPEGVRVTVLDRASSRAAVLPLARHLRASRPDVVLSAMSHANLAALLARQASGTRIPVVAAEHNALSARLGAARGLRVRAMYRSLGQAYRRWARSVVAVSQGVADDLVARLHLPRELVRVVYNPIVTDGLLRAADAPLDASVVGPDPVVLAVGRLAPQKGFERLVDAFALLRKRRPARLVILGEGPERGRLEERVARLGLTGAVWMPGFVDNPHAWMARAGVVALSSRWEGLPTVLVEALAAGAPVAAFDCTFGPREILRDGALDHLVPEGDVAALAAAMDRALAEGRRPEAVAARRARALDFTLDAAVRGYEAVLF